MDKWTGKCVGSNFVAKPIENVQITDGGINLTTVLDKENRFGKGIVISIGENAPLDPEGNPYVKAGDTILYDRNKITPYIEETIEYVAGYYDSIFKVF
jgi:co-chaperonin GroES (HSP10)